MCRWDFVFLFTWQNCCGSYFVAFQPNTSMLIRTGLSTLRTTSISVIHTPHKMIHKEQQQNVKPENSERKQSEKKAMTWHTSQFAIADWWILISIPTTPTHNHTVYKASEKQQQFGVSSTETKQKARSSHLFYIEIDVLCMIT